MPRWYRMLQQTVATLSGGRCMSNAAKLALVCTN